MLTAKQARELTDKASEKLNNLLELIERSAKEGCSSLRIPENMLNKTDDKKLEKLGFKVEILCIRPMIGYVESNVKISW